MSQHSSNNTEKNGLLTWIEPEISQLHVRETALMPSKGGDGQKKYADCTKS